MARTVIPLCENWKYADAFDENYLLPNCSEKDFQAVTLPHTNIEVPYNYFDERMYQFVSCYRNTIELDNTCAGKNIFLDFEGVMTYAEVYLNGELLGSHKGGYTPFSVDLTGKVTFGAPNTLVVKVDSRERDDIPPFGKFVDYLTFGGIYREVTLRIVDPVYIENLFVRPQQVLRERKQVEYSLFLANTSSTSQTVHVTALIKNGDTLIDKAEEQLVIESRIHEKFDFSITNIEGVTLWEINDPSLYTFEVQIVSEDNTINDVYTTRFGFRTAEFTPKGFLFNGRHLKLRGLNRHQTFPYVGQAMPVRAQRKDADILKDELHLNIVRTSHYPQSQHFLNRCDEIGLLVLEEIPGWQHIGDEAWKRVACENVREMITRDWNHPSVILWGVRINESQDDHDFFAETNRIAHELDPTRQTGGVRNIPHSELLEDVYTMNDFSHEGGELVLKRQQESTGLDTVVPYLVTEFNGHMFPIKRFDQEERLIECAARYARILSRAGEDEEICGTIGWCAFDYYTHYNFGSGDRICYHGVMDMFRIPKITAHVYRSQVSPDIEAVLEPITLWAWGERGKGVGVMPLTIYTNCEYVEFYYGNKFRGKYYPAKDEYPGLEYPPVMMTLDVGFWGCAWEEGKFVGYVNGQPVIEKVFVKDPLPTKLIATPDDTSLIADGRDVTRIVYTLVDQAGNLLPYINDFLKLRLSGPGAIIGPHEVSLIGGVLGVWVKTTAEKGMITLSAASSRLQANDVVITVE